MLLLFKKNMTPAVCRVFVFLPSFEIMTDIYEFCAIGDRQNLVLPQSTTTTTLRTTNI
jgi:hypothetical protein